MPVYQALTTPSPDPLNRGHSRLSKIRTFPNWIPFCDFGSQWDPRSGLLHEHCFRIRFRLHFHILFRLLFHIPFHILFRIVSRGTFNLKCSLSTSYILHHKMLHTFLPDICPHRVAGAPHCTGSLWDPIQPEKPFWSVFRQIQLSSWVVSISN